MYIHTVLFWLKDGTPPAERASLLKDCRESLSKIPSVRRLDAGRPAMTPRDVVDNSYDVGLSIILDDRAGHDEYQIHELHQQFVAKHKAHWKKVQIYDFL